MITNAFLILLLLIPKYIPIEISVVVYFFYFIYSIYKNKYLSISRQLIYIVAPLVFVLIIGTLNLPRHDPILYVRDLKHLLIPIVGMLFGYSLYKRNYTSEQLVKSLILSSIILSSFYILTIYQHIDQISFASFKEWKTMTAKSGMLAPIGLVIMVWCLSNKKIIFRFQKLFFTIGILLCSLTLVITMSRILIITTVIIFVIIMELHKKIPRILQVLPIIFLIILMTLLLLVNDKIKVPGNIILERYTEKLINPLAELSTPDNFSKENISSNWRGYENFIAIKQFYNYNFFEILIGSGLGTKFDMGFTVIKYGTIITSKLSLHNGYLYLLVKTGILGLLGYIVFIILNMNISIKKYHSLHLPFEKLVSKLSLSLLITGGVATLVTSGFVSNGSYLLASVIIGFSNSFARKIIQ